MPPVGFFASAASSYDAGTGDLELLVPLLALPGDVLLAAVEAPAAAAMTPPDGWALLASNTSPAVSTTSYLFVHVVGDADPAAHVFASTPGETQYPLAILLLYRGVNPLAAIVASAQAAIASSGTAFAAPSITLAVYSDLTLLLYYAIDSAGTDTFTLPAGAAQRGIVHGAGAAGGSLVVAEYLAEAVGAIGTQSATAAGASTGFAAAYAVSAMPTVVAPSIVPDVAGAIGFTEIGV